MTVWAGTAFGPSLTARPRQVGGIVPQWERLAAAEIDRDIDDTQVMLAQRHLHGPPLKPHGMTDAEWEFWRRPEWTPEEIARIRVTRSNKPHYSRSVAEYERWNAFEGNPLGWR